MRIRFLSLLFIFNLLYFSNACARATNRDTTFRFDWHIQKIPKISKLISGLFFNDSTGWLVIEEGRLLHLKNDQWRLDPFLLLELPYDVFYADKIYVLAFNELSGRWGIFSHNQGAWEVVKTPNSNKIRNVYVQSPQNIWAACEWGELLHFDGKNWNLLPGPLFMHNNAIFYQNDSSIWVAGEYTNKRIVSYWNGKQWRNYSKARTGSKNVIFREINRIMPLYENVCIGLFKDFIDSLLVLSPNNVIMTQWSQLVKDTLAIASSFFTDSSALYIKRNEQVKIHASGSRYFAVTQDEFLIWYKTNFKHFGYWKTSEGKVCFLKFLPPTAFPKSKVLYQSYPIFASVYCYGAAFVDVDKDGKEELYVIDTEAINKLFKINQEFLLLAGLNARVPNYAEKFNIGGPIKGKNNKFIFDHGVSFADIDNDGDEDAYVTSLYSQNLFYENKSGKYFVERAEQAGIDIGITRSVVGIWCDVNNDGLVDLFVTNEDTTNMLFLNHIFVRNTN